MHDWRLETGDWRLMRCGQDEAAPRDREEVEWMVAR